MTTKAFLFPGQGAQNVGMGKDLHDAFPAAQAVFERAEAVSGLPIRKLCFEGPNEDLARTDHAQPCIFTVSAALVAVLEEKLTAEQRAASRPAYMAGLSLGEYSALYAAGAADLDDILRLVTQRGAAMQSAATARPSSMVAVIGLPGEDEAKALCEAAADGQVLTPANFNCPGQIVLSGEVEACQRAADQAGEFGASGATVLNVAGAFHSELMAPAAAELETALAGVTFRMPQVPVVANVDAQPYASAAEIPAKLLAQLTGAVRWQQSMEWVLAQGMDQPFEIGPGKVLFGLMRRIARKTRVTVVNSAESLASAVEILAAD